MRTLLIYISVIYTTLPIWVLTGCAKPLEGFTFRSLYTPANTSEEFRNEYGTSHVDYDWDLWGHNLKKIIGDKPEKEMLATVADTLCNKQYCFSSRSLYNKIESFILDQYGEGTDKYSARICIMPQDNKIACTCNQCKATGNTEGNATPAVTKMLTKLAKRFPRHQFFTSSYHSTRQAPTEKLPDNVGVLMSAIELPYRVDFTKSEGYKRFTELAREWKKAANTIYVWEYERNYDDYLSPFPCLFTMQARLRLYRDLGLDGVFINGSGDDFSAFDDLQSAVIAQLLDNSETDIDNAVRAYLHRHYPATADLIADYYLALEHATAETNHVLPLYGTMEDMIVSYFDPYEFTVWRTKLDKASKATQRSERQRLNYLLTAMAFTQLRIYDVANKKESNNAQDDTEYKYIKGKIDKVRPLLTHELEEDMAVVLKGHKELKGMNYYSESLGDIDKYIRKHL